MSITKQTAIQQGKQSRSTVRRNYTSFLPLKKSTFTIKHNLGESHKHKTEGKHKQISKHKQSKYKHISTRKLIDSI